MVVFALLCALTITGWIMYEVAYERAVRHRDDIPLSWSARLRWVFLLLILVLSLIGYFTVVLRLTGAVMQPIKPAQYEQIQEPLYRKVTANKPYTIPNSGHWNTAVGWQRTTSPSN